MWITEFIDVFILLLSINRGGKCKVVPKNISNNSFNINSSSVKYGTGGGKAITHCPSTGRNFTFIGRSNASWWNPLNWAVLDDGVVNVHKTKLLPYVDRIPSCVDQVTVPTNISVEISGLVTVNKVFVNGDNIIADYKRREIPRFR